MTERIFTFNHSRILLIGLVVLHFLAVIAALNNTLPISFQMALGVFIAVHFAWHGRRYYPNSDLGSLAYSETTGWTRVVEGVKLG